MRNFLFPTALIFCFGLTYGQPLQIGADLEAAFYHTVGDPNSPTRWRTSQPRAYKDIAYNLKVEGPLKNLNLVPFITEVEGAIEELLLAGVNLEVLNAYPGQYVGQPIEFYIISGVPPSHGPYPYIGQVDEVHAFGAMAYTYDQSGNQVKRIVINGKASNNIQKRYLRGRIIHAIGRILNEYSLGPDAYWSPNAQINTLNLDAVQSFQISNYAEKSNKGFVAELFTYAVLGRLDEVIPPNHPNARIPFDYYVHAFRGPRCNAINARLQ